LKPPLNNKVVGANLIRIAEKVSTKTLNPFTCTKLGHFLLANKSLTLEMSSTDPSSYVGNNNLNRQFHQLWWAPFKPSGKKRHIAVPVDINPFN
jgi:hypothetical protein